MSENRDTYLLPHPVASGYLESPMHNVNVNIGTDDNPVYHEYRTYPAFPWKVCDMNKQGDGHESVFTPARKEPDDHSRDDPKKYWDLLVSLDAVPQPTHSTPIRGKMDYEQL